MYVAWEVGRGWGMFSAGHGGVLGVRSWQEDLHCFSSPYGSMRTEAAHAFPRVGSLWYQEGSRGGMFAGWMPLLESFLAMETFTAINECLYVATDSVMAVMWWFPHTWLLLLQDKVAAASAAAKTSLGDPFLVPPPPVTRLFRSTAHHINLCYCDLQTRYGLHMTRLELV